jgi:hypothetical protein
MGKKVQLGVQRFDRAGMISQAARLATGNSQLGEAARRDGRRSRNRPHYSDLRPPVRILE